MAKNNTDFFEEKKEWSRIKDSLLGCYLRPYFTKVLKTGRPIVYVDCFAGAGTFGDGEKGSPLLAMDIREQVLNAENQMSFFEKRNAIQFKFVEKENHEKLYYATESYSERYSQPVVYSADYRDVLLEIAESARQNNLFLYLDPFGVNVLNYSLLKQVSLMPFKSCEMLLNFNSFGLFRFACTAFGLTVKQEGNSDGDAEIRSLEIEKPSAEKVSAIVGGDFWKTIIKNYKEKRIQSHQAEEELTRGYLTSLRKMFKYVLELPLRLGEGQHPKYRMIHACNHIDGFILMAENMQGRAKDLLRLRNHQDCATLFGDDWTVSTPTDGTFVTTAKIREELTNCIQTNEDGMRLHDLIAQYTMRWGLVSSFKPIKDILLDMERDGVIRIERDPKFTKAGKPSKFMSEEKKQIVQIFKVRL